MAQPYGKKLSICTGILKEMGGVAGQEKERENIGEMVATRKAECN